MKFSYLAPSAALQDLVKDYLIAHFLFDQGDQVPLKPYAPKPEQGVTFFVRGRPSMVNPLTGEVSKAPSVSVFGQQMERCDVRLEREFLMFRVHFQPGALFRIVNIPLYKFGTGYFDAQLALGAEVREVSEQLATARSYAEMVMVVERYLMRTLSRITRNVHPADRAAMHLTADPLHASVDWLGRQTNLSPRQLRRAFTERIGVGPKVYGRLVRFHRAGLFKAAHPAVAWPTVALECGYADYQHMVRDFRQFTNDTPTLWLEQDAASPEHILSRIAPGQAGSPDASRRGTRQDGRFSPRKPDRRISY